MPISSQLPIIGYVANGVTTAFTFPFVILSADDLKVSVNNALVTTGLTITGVGDRDGGTITFSAPPAASSPIILYREVSLERTTDYQENGDLLAGVLDDDLDRLWAALQDQAVIGSQALRVPVGETVASLPKASERALKALGFDALGRPIALPQYDASSLAIALQNTTPSNDGAALVGADDGASGSLWATVAGFIAFLLSSLGASVIGFIQSGAGAVVRRVIDKLRESVSGEDFGADKTGTNDSTDAIFNKALATGKDVKLVSGTYKISPSSNLNVANNGVQRIYGEGDVTLSISLASSINMILFAGPVSLENLTLDFNNGPAQYAFRWAANAGHITLKNIRIKNLKDTDPATGTIVFWIIPTGNTFDVQGIRASSLLKRGNGNITDAAGSLNVIYVGGGAGATRGSIRDVFVSDIHNINASDQIIYEDTSTIYVLTESDDSQNRILIQNVQGYNFGKRLLKVHASNVSVKDVMGYSSTGDSLSVVGFMTGQGVGEKYGCSAENVRAYGTMEVACASGAPGVKWKNIIVDVAAPSLPGTTGVCVGFWPSVSDCTLDGATISAQLPVTIGTSSSAIKNTVIRNASIQMTSANVCGIRNSSDSIGFDGLVLDGIRIVCDSSTTAVPIDLSSYFNGTTKVGKNLVIKDLVIESSAPAQASNFNGMVAGYVTNVSLLNFSYKNSGAATHKWVSYFNTCSNVTVDTVNIEGAHERGVFVFSCTGRSTIYGVYAPGATQASVYNNNSSEVYVANTKPDTIVSANTPANQNSRLQVGTTAQRPTVGLFAGYSQYYDTTLGKPIWWNGSVWKDSAGTTV